MFRNTRSSGFTVLVAVTALLLSIVCVPLMLLHFTLNMDE